MSRRIMNLWKDDIKKDFNEITDFAKELGTTTENLLLYIIANGISEITGEHSVGIECFGQDAINDLKDIINSKN